MVQDTVVVCSVRPGFLRDAAIGLHHQFQVVECGSLPELDVVVRRYRPAVAVIDLDGEPVESMRHPPEAIVAVRTFLFTTCHDRAAAVSDWLSDTRQLLHFTATDRHPAGLQEFIRRRITLADSDDSIKEPGSVPSLHGQAANTRSAADGLPANGTTIPLTPLSRGFRTHTPALQEVLDRLTVAARHHVTLLLIGETGSGKTFLARQIHEASPRRQEPFLHVACGALPAELIASELFGHVKGAFTGAHADKDGKFLAAGTGTLLLDEIDVLTPEQQVNLLRVIETGEFEPVGSNRTLKVQARIIAASNLDLQPLVESGQFRPDLYYRLNMLKFEIPPLRRRRPDVEPLARHFIAQCAENYGIEITTIEPDFLDTLIQYPWPGNVRELENAVRSAVIYCDNEILARENLPPHIVACIAGPSNDASVTAFLSTSQSGSLGDRLELTEKDIIHEALMRNRFSRTKTARDLGISRVTLYNKMKKYEIVAAG